MDFSNKEHAKSFNVVQPQQVHHPQIIIENPLNNNIHLSYCEVQQKNKPQSNSVAGGVLLMLVSGMHIGWGIWRIILFEPWMLNMSIEIFKFLLMSWYVFAVVGSIVGAVLVTKMKKKFIYYIGGALFIVSNIMFIALYKERKAIIAGRCLAGLAHGIIYNATVTHAAENVVKEIRGMLFSSINCIIFSGVFVSTVLSAAITYDLYDWWDISPSYRMTRDTVFGIFGLTLSVLSIICNTFMTYESVPYLLRTDNEAEAIVTFLKLRNESVMTPKLINYLDEMKLMVDQDRQDNQNIFSNGNGSTIGKMIALRVLATMTNNYLINYTLLNMTMLLVDPDVSFEMAPMILSGSRLAVSFIPVFSTDFIRRKIHLTVSSVTSGIVMLILAIIVTAVTGLLSYSWLLGALAIVFQIFVGLGIDPMQHLLLSEAFSTSKKAWSIALVTSVEYLLQIFFIGIYFVNFIDRVRFIVILFVTAGVMLALAFLLQLAIPETFKKSLKETRDLFCK